MFFFFKQKTAYEIVSRDWSSDVCSDLVRADFEDGWGLVRASNTTPVLVLRFEADSDAALARIMKMFRNKMKEVEPYIIPLV